MSNSEKFIEKASKVHNNYYDYSSIIYVNTHTKVEILCPVHGYFYQSPANHQKGVGCPLCSNITRAKSKTKSLDNFLIKANEVHNDFYIYEKTKFEKRSEKSIITCPIHGDFLQTPANHLKGQGCPECGKIKASLKRTKSSEQYIIDASIVHNNYYDYSKTIYVNNNDKVIIICPEHGEFEQKANNHLQGKGCAKCRDKKLSLARRDTFENFVLKANIVHNNLYEYYKSDFTNHHDKVKILCKKHGDFEQSINSHLKGRGCPSCNSSKGEIMISNWLKINYPNLEYIEQYRADWLKGLIYDFYIPTLNLAIEYNGIQHYKAVEFFGGEEYFDYCVNNDNLKEKYSNENKTTLVIIKYNNEKEDMQKLKEVLC